jgi:hypothetical protein
MLIEGEWYQTDEVATRPVLRGEVRNYDGGWTAVEFLIDTCADITIFSAATYSHSGFPDTDESSVIKGVGGQVSTTPLTPTLRFRSAHGTEAERTGPYVAVKDQKSLDMSLLGQDVLDVFQLVVDRPGRLILLLAAPDTYRIELSSLDAGHAQS